MRLRRFILALILGALFTINPSVAYGDSFSGGSGARGPQGPAGADGTDGAPGTPGYSANSITSGCGVVYSGSGLTYTVAPCVVTIGGTTYTISTETSVTLDAADGSNPRIDLIIATSSSTVTKVSGTAAASPAAPELDPATQVQLSFVTVGAGATTPSNVSTEIIYDENNDWTCTASDASNVCNSTTNPHAGTTTIEGTSVANNDYVQLVDGDGTFALTTYNTISLYLRSKATWSAHSTLTLQWYNGTSKVGSEVVIRPTDTFEFTSSDTTTHQLLVIPTSLFGTGGTSVDRIRFTKKGSGTIGYYLDDIKLQGGVQSTITGTADMQFQGSWSSTANYTTNQVVTYGGAMYVAVANNTNVTPGTDATKWTGLTSPNVLKRSFGVFVGEPGGSALADTADTPACFINQLGYSITITECCCTVDSTTGSPAVMFQRDDGTAANILSGNLACATAAGSGCTTSFSGSENVIADGQEVDCNIATAGGTAVWASMQCAYTVP